MLLERGVSGIIFVSGLHADTGADHARYQSLVERHLPVVFVNGYLPGVEAPFVSSDEYAAMELAVSHLVALGHQRIGFASGPERFTVVKRKLAGYRTTMKAQLGLSDDELDPLISLSMFGVEGGHAAAQPLLDAGVSAVVCGSDMMALGVIRAARQRGLSSPHRPLSSRLRRRPHDGVHRPPNDHHPPTRQRHGPSRRPIPPRGGPRPHHPPHRIPLSPRTSSPQHHRPKPLDQALQQAQQQQEQQQRNGAPLPRWSGRCRAPASHRTTGYRSRQTRRRCATVELLGRCRATSGHRLPIETERRRRRATPAPVGQVPRTSAASGHTPTGEQALLLGAGSHTPVAAPAMN